MDHGQLSMVADKFQWVFSEALLNACGKDVRFCHRERTITPFRLGEGVSQVWMLCEMNHLNSWRCNT